jgi:hypothetical protein
MQRGGEIGLLQTWATGVPRFSTRSVEVKPESSLASPDSGFEGEPIHVLNQTKIDCIDRETLKWGIWELRPLHFPFASILRDWMLTPLLAPENWRSQRHGTRGITTQYWKVPPYRHRTLSINIQSDWVRSPNWMAQWTAYFARCIMRISLLFSEDIVIRENNRMREYKVWGKIPPRRNYLSTHHNVTFSNARRSRTHFLNPR